MYEVTICQLLIYSFKNYLLYWQSYGDSLWPCVVCVCMIHDKKFSNISLVKIPGQNQYLLTTSIIQIQEFVTDSANNFQLLKKK